MKVFSIDLNLPNILGLSPAECAEKHGYHSLAQELRGLAPAAPMSSLAASSPNVIEGEDGYLIPEIADNQSFSDYQIPQIGNRRIPSSYVEKCEAMASKSRLDSGSSDEFYQVPPAPVPLTSTSINNNYIPSSPPDTSSSLTSSSSTPPKYRISRQGLGYIPMLPPIRKALSDIGPKSDSNIFVPKSGSFSHFTATATSPVRRDELIAKFCQVRILFKTLILWRS